MTKNKNVGQGLNGFRLKNGIAPDRKDDRTNKTEPSGGVQKRGLVEISPVAKKKEEEPKEFGRAANILVRRVESTETGEKKEKEFQELEKKSKELEESRRALLNILEDVEKERERAEDEKSRTEAIVRSLADGLLLLEGEKITLFNPKAEEFFGLKEEEVKKKIVWSLEENTKIAPLIKLLKTGEKQLFRKELSLGENLILEVSTTPVLRGGKEVGKTVILHDVTREKVIERMKTEFVSITAHQLRTPLSAIKWILRMMLDGDLGSLSGTQKEFLEKIYVSNERMIKLINDLLNITRLEEGRFLYNVRKYNIVEIVEKAIVPLKEVAKRRGIKLEFKKPQKKIPKIFVDAEKISLIIQNLVDNSLRYTRRGGVIISLDYLEREKQVLFKIKDSGIGIPQDQQGRVFSRFFRAINAIRTEPEGTGLGLFIAKNIIEAHKGKIWFESEENKGTTFYFTLPSREPEEEFEKFIEGF